MAASNVNELPFCQAHVHRSQVVNPSELIPSSIKIGLGGGGTKFPDHKPPSLPSSGSGDRESSFGGTFQVPALRLLPLGITTDT